MAWVEVESAKSALTRACAEEWDQSAEVADRGSKDWASSEHDGRSWEAH